MQTSPPRLLVMKWKIGDTPYGERRGKRPMIPRNPLRKVVERECLKCGKKAIWPKPVMPLFGGTSKSHGVNT